MKLSEAAKEITAILIDAEARGGKPASPELRAFLNELSASPGLRKPVKRATRNSDRTLSGAVSRVGRRPKRPTEAEMAKTIDELAKKLNDAFHSDERFEAVLRDEQTLRLSKSNVVTLYRRVFENAQPPSKSWTKPDLFNAMRRARINRVRGQM